MADGEVREIDLCIVCFTDKPPYSLSQKLEARNVNDAENRIEGPDGDGPDGPKPCSSSSLGPINPQTNKTLDNRNIKLEVSSSESTDTDISSLSDYEFELPANNPVDPAQHSSDSSDGFGENEPILSQLRTFFVLKNVLKHPLEHLSTEKMMLLVRCPSDWFGLCDTCSVTVDQGIMAIESLKTNSIPIYREIYGNQLERSVDDLRQRFIDGYLETTPPQNWEFVDQVQMERYGDVSTTNYLLTEAEAVLEFRRFVHTTSFARLQELVSPSTPTTETASDDSERNEDHDEDNEVLDA